MLAAGGERSCREPPFHNAADTGLFRVARQREFETTPMSSDQAPYQAKVCHFTKTQTSNSVWTVWSSHGHAPHHPHNGLNCNSPFPMPLSFSGISAPSGELCHDLYPVVVQWSPDSTGSPSIRSLTRKRRCSQGSNEVPFARLLRAPLNISRRYWHNTAKTPSRCCRSCRKSCHTTA